MNKQRKVLITTTYNEMGVIIDTKAEEVAQQNLQPTCNQLATDTISRQAAIDALTEYGNGRAVFISVGEAVIRIEQLPSAEPKMGHWIIYTVSPFDGEDVKCSECGQRGCATYWDYCPNCGSYNGGEEVADG